MPDSPWLNFLALASHRLKENTFLSQDMIITFREWIGVWLSWKPSVRDYDSYSQLSMEFVKASNMLCIKYVITLRT